ncbi:MAG: hypothetical protein ACI9H8_001425 [Lysobacterales bacterium]|jgi:hypothetical protein
MMIYSQTKPTGLTGLVSTLGLFSVKNTPLLNFKPNRSQPWNSIAVQQFALSAVETR